nr:PREDICTED: 39S ribosomal protein L40, mitochondrial [Bemisia tabaci]
MFKLLNTFSRLNICSNAAPARSIATDSSLWIQASSVLYGEPLKKKKKIDPAIVRAREDRKKKKIERAIKKLKRQANRPKPVDEIEVPYELVDQKELRERPAAQWSEEELLEKHILLKKWTLYKQQRRLEDLQLIDRMVYSQQRALDELKLASPRLYEAAIQIDPELLPYSTEGPVYTPPVKDYDSPDGEYLDVSKKWE